MLPSPPSPSPIPLQPPLLLFLLLPFLCLRQVHEPVRDKAPEHEGTAEVDLPPAELRPSEDVADHGEGDGEGDAKRDGEGGGHEHCSEVEDVRHLDPVNGSAWKKEDQGKEGSANKGDAGVDRDREPEFPTVGPFPGFDARVVEEEAERPDEENVEQPVSRREPSALTFRDAAREGTDPTKPKNKEKLTRASFLMRTLSKMT